MNIQKIILLSSTALALAACASGMGKMGKFEATAPVTYQCEKGGNLTVQQIAHDKVTLRMDTIGETITLTQAVSGSGVRYANPKGFYGKATDLHMKGKIAQMTFIDPYGNEVNASCDRK